MNASKYHVKHPAGKSLTMATLAMYQVSRASVHAWTQHAYFGQLMRCQATLW